MSTSQPDGPDSTPVTDRLPTSTPASEDGTEGGGRSAADRAQAIAVLDEPLDDKELSEQIRRSGMSSSTRWLLRILLAVVIFLLGAFLGRAIAPDTGPGSAPDVVGTVESSGAAGGQLTVRTADGQLVVLGTTPGTRVAVPRADGLAGVRPGEQVVVSAQVNQLGSLDATHVDIAASP